nr:FecR family protein [Parabacteroides goldsteinii]
MQTEQTPIALQTITVPAGQRINITLADGTNVWLNARTTIQYPITFNEKERLVKLDGEAYFDVTKDKSKPFIVQTNNYNVEVLGTKFDVDSYSETEIFETTLMEGSVRISSLTDANESLMLTLPSIRVVSNISETWQTAGKTGRRLYTLPLAGRPDLFQKRDICIDHERF